MNTTKRCWECKKTKPIDDFGKASSTKDGHCALCRKCAAARKRAWNRKNQKLVRERAAKRWREKVKPSLAADPVLKERHLVMKRAYKARLGADGRRDATLRQKYRISLDEFSRMQAAQAGACAICFKRKPLLVDHCHETGKVRGLLCHGCNRSIGMLGDSVAGLKNALNYLEDTSAQTQSSHD